MLTLPGKLFLQIADYCIIALSINKSSRVVAICWLMLAMKSELTGMRGKPDIK